MQFSLRKIILIALVVGIGIFFYYFKTHNYFSLENIKQHKVMLKAFVEEHYVYSVFLFLAIFSIAIACGLPIIIPFAVIGGFLYGIYFGLLYVTISCLIGSLVSFLVLRYVVVHWIRGWHDEQLNKFHKRLERFGYSYLFILQFLSVIPLFVINMLAAVANVPLRIVLLATAVGTFPLNLLCVFAGQRLSDIQSFNEIFSPTMVTLLLILAAIATIPLFLKKNKGFF